MPTSPPRGAPARRVSGPRYQLNLLQFHLAAVGGKRASRAVIEFLGFGAPKAEAHIRRMLSELMSKHYVETLEMPWDPIVVADVYAFEDEFCCWYVKFYEQHGRVVVVSFHPIEHDIVCADGTHLKVSR